MAARDPLDPLQDLATAWTNRSDDGVVTSDAERRRMYLVSGVLVAIVIAIVALVLIVSGRT